MEKLKYQEFINPEVKFSMISSIDIAKIASALFKDPKTYNHQDIEIASDELTLNEVVKTFATVTGKPTEIEGEFYSGTAEEVGLKIKGYVYRFCKMERLNPRA